MRVRVASAGRLLALAIGAAVVAACSVTPVPLATPTPGVTVGPSTTAVPTIGPSGGTASPGPTAATVVIAAAGDISCDPTSHLKPPQNCDAGSTAVQILNIDPAAVLALGDEQYENGRPVAWAAFDATWGQFKSRILPAPGNHEYLTANAAGYYAYFGAAAGNPNQGWYSVNLGAWHLIALNSECRFVGGCGPGSPQEQWLKADLAADTAACTLAFWHEPRWSSGEHGDATQMTTIWADLVAAHVDVVLSGHNHDYERFVPLDANGSPDPSGVQEFVVGTGGKNHYPFKAPPLTGEAVRDDTSFGVLELSLAPDSYTWHFRPAPSYAFTDSGTMTCR